MATLTEQLDAMKALAPNWDGYNADPPNHDVLDQAKLFVRLLESLRPVDSYEDIFVHPGRAGGVQIGWTDERYEHELDIEPDGTWGILHIDRQTGRMTEKQFSPPKAQILQPGILRELTELLAA
jgi:hypothetical protein